MKPNNILKIIFFAWLLMFVGGCARQPPTALSDKNQPGNTTENQITFTLVTKMQDGKMLYIGSGGDIDGMINPDLRASVGDTINIVLINGDGIPHDVAFELLGVQSRLVSKVDQKTTLRLQTQSAGTYFYYCAVSGHRQAGMEGKLIITETH